MADKWCPENDGAYRAEMAAFERAKEEHHARSVLNLTPAQAAGLAAGTHVVVPVEAEEIDPAAAAFVIAFMKRHTGLPFGDMIGMSDKERIVQAASLAAEQKEG